MVTSHSPLAVSLSKFPSVSWMTLEASARTLLQLWASTASSTARPAGLPGMACSTFDLLAISNTRCCNC